jgi:crotonobetainyl-CoA:carnitine CoA-transferase CaiB-like acyl-CoA transferase
MGTVTLAAPVPRLSDTPGRIAYAGHRVGQDTRKVLNEIVNYTNEQIDRLVEAKVVFEKRAINDETIKGDAQ